MQAPGHAAAQEKEKSAMLVRSSALFANFFLIILAYYQVKSPSRSFVIEYGGAQLLPYAWVYSAVTLTLLIGFYHHLVARFSRAKVVLSSLLLFALCFIAFRYVFTPHDTTSAMAFYVFVDIFSVILVEQFWSLTDSIHNTEQGKRSYWFVGTGGLLGGVLGGVLASALIHYAGLGTSDLLVSCALLLLVTFGLNLAMWRAGMYGEIKDGVVPAEHSAGDWRVLFKSRYLLLIAGVLCLSQLAEPIVEYQFLSEVQKHYTDLDARTAFISEFLSVLGVVSIGVNVVLTPAIHRWLGAIGGMIVQPTTLLVCALGFYLSPTFLLAGVMKIADRGLSYSINRASKELLYIPIDPVSTYQAKAWIDMFGYRLFKALGSGLILIATQWLPLHAAVTELSWLTAIICGLWIIGVMLLGQAYRNILVSV